MSGSPLGRTGQFLLEALGISKNADSFIRNMNTQLIPVVNAWPFFVPEASVQEGYSLVPALGHNTFYTNSSPKTEYLAGVSAYCFTLGAGVALEGVPTVFGNNNFIFYTPVGPGLSVGVGQQYFSGQQFFESPLPLPPGWGLGFWLRSLTGIAPSMTIRSLLIRV